MPRTLIPPKVRWQVLARDGFRCRYCGAQGGDAVLHVDHQRPVARGGGNQVWNLITACEECNQGKSDSATPTFAEIDTYSSAATSAAGWLHMEWIGLFTPFDYRMALKKSTLIYVVRDSVTYNDALDTLMVVAEKCQAGDFGPEPWALEGYTLDHRVVGYADWKSTWMDSDPDDDDYAAYVARFWEETPF